MGLWAFVGLLLASGLGVAGPRDAEPDPLNELRVEYREASTRNRVISVRRESQVRILKRALDLRTDEAIAWVLAMIRTAAGVDLQRDALRLLAEEVPHRDDVVRLFREFVAPKHPLRPLARDFMLDWAIRKGERPFLLRLFESGDTEDRFLAVQALGRIGAPESLECAWKLLENPRWIVRSSTVVHCGTLATAMRRHEGDEAARFLLLLQRDSRFRPDDAGALRQATRTWRYIDLTRYIDLKELSHPDGVRREMMARFMGRAGFEGARAPLLALAKNRRERVEVRAAATESLGWLRLARADLARELAVLLTDPKPEVRSAAIVALAHLGVKSAVAALLPQLKSESEAEIRAALAKQFQLPPETDWARWLGSKDCALSQGT